MNQSTRCPHGLNPAACLTCFHAPKPQATKPALQNAATPLPGRADGRHVEAPARPESHIGQAGSGITVTDEERARYRNQPVNAPAAPPTGQTRSAPLKEPYSSAQEDGSAYSQDKLWEPPPRPEIIDRLPRHPEAGKVR